MNFRCVFYILGLFLFGFGLIMLLPLGTTVYYGESDAKAFLVASGITIFCSLLLKKGCYLEKPHIGNREGFAIVTLIWVLISLFGSIPYMLTVHPLSFTDAFFEAVSGITTTGASIMPDIEKHTNGILFWRSITHWLGGMGIIVLGLAVLPILGIGGMELFKAEVSGPTDDDKLTPKVKDTARILMKVYLGLTLALVGLLYFFGMTFFDALNHAFSTVSSGGFSTKNLSIAHYKEPAIHWTITLFMVLAAINFYIHVRWMSGRVQVFWTDLETRILLLMLCVTSTVFCFNLMLNHTYKNLETCIRETVFTVASIASSTGFALANYETWPVFCQATLVCIMFFGASAGSTAGGIKTIRLIILSKFAYQQIWQLIHPKAIQQIKLNSQTVKPNTISSILGFVLIFLGTFAVGGLALCWSGHDMVTSFSASMSCLSNVGPGLAEVGPMDNFSQISTFGKWILSFLMILGRLEILTCLVLFTPVFWKD